MKKENVYSLKCIKSTIIDNQRIYTGNIYLGNKKIGVWKQSPKNIKNDYFEFLDDYEIDFNKVAKKVIGDKSFIPRELFINKLLLLKIKENTYKRVCKANDCTVVGYVHSDSLRYSEYIPIKNFDEKNINSEEIEKFLKEIFLKDIGKRVVVVNTNDIKFEIYKSLKDFVY